MDSTAISLKDVSKAYIEVAKAWAVKDFSLEVSSGEFLCVVGPSGCGKSTLLKLIAGIEQPTEGSLERPARISMVFQSGALFPWLTALENVEFGLKMVGFAKYRRTHEASRYLSMVNLDGLLDKYPRELSGGQRQRVGIARALAQEPQALLLDEPFSSLDTITTDDLHRDLLHIWHQLKPTIVMVSHSLEEAVYLADRVVVMSGGRVKSILEVNLKRPRGEKDAKFLEEVKKLKKEFV